jgi:hypothetical protein
MKTIHILFAAALASSPFTAYAQEVEEAPAEPEAVQAVDPAAVEQTDIGSTGTGTGDIGSTGTGTGDIGSTGSGTGDIGSTGTGTGTIGSTGSGTGDIGSTGTGTGTVAAGAWPVVSLHARSTSLRTPGTMQLTVSLAAMPELSPAEGRNVDVPLASSSAECTVPASVSVPWTSTGGGLATVSVTCGRAPNQTVTVGSGAASASFVTR